MSERPDFLATLMAMQKHWEMTREGQDMSVWEYNSPANLLERLEQERIEAVEAVAHGTLAMQKDEAADMLILLASLFNHLEMDPAEVEETAMVKMARNYRKYTQENFKGRNVTEAFWYSRNGGGNE